MTTRLEQLLRYHEDDPADDFIVFALAKEYEKQGNTTEALARYEFLKDRNRYYLGVYYHLGQILHEIDEDEKALAVYEEGIKYCMEKKDLHALAELQNAKTNLEMEML